MVQVGEDGVGMYLGPEGEERKDKKESKEEKVTPKNPLPKVTDPVNYAARGFLQGIGPEGR